MRAAISSGVAVVLFFCLLQTSNAQTTAWIPYTSGTYLWNDALNWDNGVPEAGFNVVVNTTGTIDATTPVVAANLTLFGSGTLTFQDALDLNSVTVANAGSLDIRSATGVTLRHVQLSGSSSRLLIGPTASVEILESFIWSGASSKVDSPNSAGGTLNLRPGCVTQVTGSVSITDVTVRNFGELNFMTSSLGLSLDSSLVNEAGGVFNIAPTSSMNPQITGLFFAFYNYGDLFINLFLSTNQMTFNCRFFNHHSMVVNNGVVLLKGDATHNGNFSHTTSGTINFNGGIHELTATSVVNVGNGIRFTAGTITISGAFYAQTFVHSGSSTRTNFTVAYTSTEPLTIIGGTLTFASASLNSLTIQGSSTSSVTAVDFRSGASVISDLVLTGTGSEVWVTGPATSVNITQSFAWGGSSCQVASGSGPGGRLNLSPSCRSTFTGSGTQYVENVAIYNYGHVAYNALSNGMYFRLGGQFWNEAGAIFNVTSTSSSDTSISDDSSSTHLFVNNGTVVVSLGSSARSLKMRANCNNNGVINVLNGILEFSGDGVHSGTFNHLPNTFIRFFDGIHTLAAGSVVSDGAGIIFAGSTVTVSGTFVPSSFQITSKSVVFTVPYTSTAALTVTGRYTLLAFAAGATLNTITISTDAQLDFRGGSSVVSILDLQGTTTLGWLGITGNSTVVNVTNELRWVGLNSQLTVSSGSEGGRLNLLPSCLSTFEGTGNAQFIKYVSVSNYGTVLYSPIHNGITLSSGGSFRNELGALFNVSEPDATENTLFSGGSNDSFTNFGHLSINVRSGFACQFACRFDNAGFVSVNSGALVLEDGTHSGTFNHSSTTFIRFSSGTIVLGPSSVVNAGNGIVFNGAATTIQGHFEPSSFTHSNNASTTFDNNVASFFLCSVSHEGGSLTFGPSITSTTVTTLTPSAGSITFAKDAVISELVARGTAVTQFQGLGCINKLQVDGDATLSIGPAAQLNVRNQFLWTGSGSAKIVGTGSGSGSGEINLLSSCRSVFNTTGTIPALSNVEINNYGLLNYNAGMMTLNGATIRNQPTGRFMISPTASESRMLSVTPSHLLYNYGHMEVAPSSNVVHINTTFENYGTLHLGSGRWVSAATATLVTGQFTMESAGVFEGDLQMQGGVLDGLGTVQGSLTQTGGVVRPGGPDQIGRLTFDSWDMQQGGNLEVESQSTSSSGYDSVLVSTNCTLQGQITFKGISPFTPPVATFSAVVSAQGALSGAFARLSSNVSISTSFSATQVDLSVTGATAPFTCSNCQHGDCVAANTCRCREGYKGSDCSQFDCPLGCNGFCLGPNHCVCPTSSVGFDCSTPVPQPCMVAIWCSAGCSDPLSPNYDPSATVDDGSCLHPCNNNTCISPPPNYCTGSVATIFSRSGTCDGEYSCEYTSMNVDCQLSGAECVEGICISNATGTTGTIDTMTTASPATTETTATTGSSVTETAASSTGVATAATTVSGATTGTSVSTGDQIKESSDDETALALGVGIGVGGGLLCCLALAAVLVLRRKNKRKQLLEDAASSGDISMDNVNNAGDSSSSQIPANPKSKPKINRKPSSTAYGHSPNASKNNSNNNSQNNSNQPIGTYESIDFANNNNNNNNNSGGNNSKGRIGASTSISNMNAWTGSIEYKELEIGSKAGAGAFGVVYASKWRGTTVAVKVMSPTLSAEAREAFLLEAAIMKNLQPHPNVVQFLGVCVSPEGSLCLVTQFCKEGSLYALLHSDRKLEKHQTIQIIKDITAGMLHLSAEKIVHRDLAARNVLLSENFQSKVADFGMSRVIATDVSVTDSNVGPLKHMSPESLLTREYSEKSDVWAWAITVWETFSRQDPYPDLTAVETAARVCQISTPYALAPPSNMSSEMAELYSSCLRFMPNDRPTFSQIAAQLEKIKTFFK